MNNTKPDYPAMFQSVSLYQRALELNIHPSRFSTAVWSGNRLYSSGWRILTTKTGYSLGTPCVIVPPEGTVYWTEEHELDRASNNVTVTIRHLYNPEIALPKIDVGEETIAYAIKAGISPHLKSQMAKLETLVKMTGGSPGMVTGIHSLFISVILTCLLEEFGLTSRQVEITERLWPGFPVIAGDPFSPDEICTRYEAQVTLFGPTTGDSRLIHGKTMAEFIDSLRNFALTIIDRKASE